MMIERKLSNLALSDNGFLFDSASGHTYTLNSTGTFILRKLIERTPREQIVDAMTEEYDTSEETLSQDVDRFFHFLSELGLIDEV